MTTRTAHAMRARVARALRAETWRDDRPDTLRTDTERRRAHNRTVHAWLSGETIGANECAILDLLAGAWSWCGDGSDRLDPFSREYVAEPLVAALRNALNYDLGTLYGASLSDVVESLALTCGVPQ